jgi:hypothetical protein
MFLLFLHLSLDGWKKQRLGMKKVEVFLAGFVVIDV